MMCLMPYETMQMVAEEIRRLCFLGNLDAREPNTSWLCTASQLAAGHGHLMLQPRRGNISALLAALEVTPGSQAPYELISQDDGEIYKLKIAYRSLFTALMLKPRPRHPYIWTQRLSK